MRLASLACTVACASAIHAGPAVQIRDGGSATDWLETKLPFQNWHELGAHAQGVLYAGPPINWGRQVGDGKSVQYWFYTGGDAAHVPYFPWKGAGENRMQPFGVMAPGRKEVRFPDVAMISPATGGKEWGLSDEEYLADIEINGGAGAAGGNELHFVGTKITIIDGKDGNPVAKTAMAQARAVWDQLARDNERELRARLADAGRTAGPPYGDETETRQFGVFPTWTPATHTLRFAFYERLARESSKTERRPTPPIHCPRGAPCAHPPPFQDVTLTRRYAAELALVVDVDAHGVIAATRFGPSAGKPQP